MKGSFLRGWHLEKLKHKQITCNSNRKLSTQSGVIWFISLSGYVHLLSHKDNVNLLYNYLSHSNQVMNHQLFNSC